MFASLTNHSLSLPSLHRAVPGLLVAAIGLFVPAQEARGADSPPANPGPMAAYFAGPGVADTNLAIGADDALAPKILQLPDGTTIMTISWDTNNGDSIDRHSADLVLTAIPVPEPSYPFLGACAGCVVLLHRRRTKPSKLRPARVKLSGDLGLERLSSQCSARAPQNRVQGSRRLIARRTSGRPARAA